MACKLATPPYTREPSSDRSAAANMTPANLTSSTIKNWRRLEQLLEGSECVLDGTALDIASVVGVAKYGAPTVLSNSPAMIARIDQSVELLRKHLKDGHLVYGVTTGFGGSADTRTTHLESLQRSLVQMQNSGILTSRDIGRPQSGKAASNSMRSRDMDVDFSTNSMPTSWVRASMLTRVNSIIRGHSGVRVIIAETILTMLRLNITPVVPLRGSISASGDLSPLSYIAGAIEGSPDIFVRFADEGIMTAEEALKKAGIAPVTLQAKEGLGLLNGTAFSAATAALALHQAQEVALLSQVLTAMAVEALRGSAESFWPHLARMRPHPGQIESAANILSFLDNSKLARSVNAENDVEVAGLCQDRYAIRTASQWIGPQLEDLLHAQAQITTELNSTTDNPLIDVENDHILHGGNFQAAVVTSTMDRARMCLERLGKMVFSQTSEIINPAMNNGLPANLAADDPSTSFTCKGVDINMASYQSELGFLANPVGNHVQSAEMHNQAINSLALISSRYTFQALDLTYLMSAASLFILCQALDLRVLQMEFLQEAEIRVKRMVESHFGSVLPNKSMTEEVFDSVWGSINTVWPTTTNFDLAYRCEKTAEAVLLSIVQSFILHNQHELADLSVMTKFTTELRTELGVLYDEKRAKMFSEHLTITPEYLGNASRRMYQFVRVDLGVALHRGLVEHPTQPLVEKTMDAKQRRTVGSRISVIYEALRDGRGGRVLMNCAEEALQDGTGGGTRMPI
ncbi:hypothetical protein MBLNU459_g3257t1 [Dothideomycetes sp. NU459]